MSARRAAGGQERREMASTDSSDTNKEKKGVEKKRNEGGKAGNACHNSACVCPLTDGGMDGPDRGRRGEVPCV